MRPASGNGGAGTERVELPGEIRKPGIEAESCWELGSGSSSGLDEKPI